MSKRAELDAQGLYVAAGHAYLVCPQLLKLDRRHGRHWSRHHFTWKDPLHADYLADLEGHTVNDFYYWPGHRPPLPGEIPACLCGSALVWADGDPL